MDFYVRCQEYWIDSGILISNNNLGTYPFAMIMIIMFTPITWDYRCVEKIECPRTAKINIIARTSVQPWIKKIRIKLTIQVGRIYFLFKRLFLKRCRKEIIFQDSQAIFYRPCVRADFLWAYKRADGSPVISVWLAIRVPPWTHTTPVARPLLIVA